VLFDMQNIKLQKSFFSKMFLIRAFENIVLDLFSQGKLYGTTHAYIGQEANAVGVISALDSQDIVVSNHRCHGHYLSFKNNPYALLCEMMGKEDGLCAGRGGSQHICDGNFFSNGVQGGIMPFSAGLAYAEKKNKSSKIVTVFIGDGTLGEGAVYEVLNIISKWKLPLLVIVENNRYAQSTKIEKTLAGSISERFKSFGIETEEISSFNVLEIFDMATRVVASMRNKIGPACMVINTYRFASHSKSDDGRDQEEIESWLEHDPLKLIENELPSVFVDKQKKKIETEINKIVSKALEAPLAK